MSLAWRGRERNCVTEAGLNHHGTGRELYLYFGGLEPTLGGAYWGWVGAAARLGLKALETDIKYVFAQRFPSLCTAPFLLRRQ